MLDQPQVLCVPGVALDGSVVTGLGLRGWLQEHMQSVQSTGQTAAGTDSGVQNPKVNKNPELILWVLVRIRHLLPPRGRL